MPLREWAKKHMKSSSSEGLNIPSFQISAADTKNLTALQFLDPHTPHESGSNRVHPNESKHRSLLNLRHGASQNSLPEWNPPDELDPNAERHWEIRATELAKLRPKSLNASAENLADIAKLGIADRRGASPDGRLLPEPDSTGWVDAGSVRGMSLNAALLEAIRLHEEGGRAIGLWG
jgi:hypothetical protein